MKRIIIVILLFSSLTGICQKFPNLANTPPMGWNSWNTFATQINEKLILETADLLSSNGMKDAGYTYLVLDDAWMASSRNSNGEIIADPIKFPHGMKFISDYIHSKGLKFGLYNCVGTKTCAGYPGARGNEYQDARFYASQGVDYVKFDWCYSDGLNAKEAYHTMSKALKTAGRPIVFSLCEWGNNKPWEWADSVGHLWRTTGDISNQFEGVKKMGNWSANSVMKIVDFQEPLRKYAGPGHWNDPDMLEVGNGMSAGEDRIHFSLWCMMAAPLMLGNDIRKMNSETMSTLTNPIAISLDQDSLGIQGFRYSQKDSLEIWVKPLKNESWGIGFVNRSHSIKNLDMDWSSLNLKDELSQRILDFTKENYLIQNAWGKLNQKTTKKRFKTLIPGHDILLLKLRKIN